MKLINLIEIKFITICYIVNIIGKETQFYSLRFEVCNYLANNHRTCNVSILNLFSINTKNLEDLTLSRIMQS